MHTLLTINGWKRAWIALFLAFTPVASFAQTPPPLPNAVTLTRSSVPLSQSVTVSVQEINELSISSDVSLTIMSATPGGGPLPATDASATYNITTNGTNKKLVGSLDSNFPPGISLKMLLQAPGAASSSEQTLSDVAVDLTSGFGRFAAIDLTISYTAEATISVAPNGAGESRIVTMTLMDN